MEKTMNSWEPRPLDEQVDLPMWYDINQEIICQFNTNFIYLKIDDLNDHLKIIYNA